jgi:hypothetical protein
MLISGPPEMSISLSAALAVEAVQVFVPMKFYRDPRQGSEPEAYFYCVGQ